MRKENRVVIHWLKEVKKGINKSIEQVQKSKPSEIEDILNKNITQSEKDADRIQNFLWKCNKKDELCK